MTLAAPRSVSQEVTDDPPLSPSGVTPFGSSYLGFFRLSSYGLVTLALTPVQILILLIVPRMWWALPFAYHKLCCRIMGLKVRVVGVPAKARPLLLVSNHVSYLDIPVLGSIVPVCFVAKTEVAKWPGYGWLAKLQRTVFVDRRRNTTLQQRDSLHQRLAEGDALVLFPEGTSNDGNRILPFRSALLSVAEASPAERPLVIQPVSIAYTSVNGVPLGWGLRPLVAWYGGMELGGHLWRFSRLGRVEVVVQFHGEARAGDFLSRKELTRYCSEAVAGGVDRALGGRLLTAPAEPEKAQS
ncbi:MAG TPA: lysophospholipid acyltransferase family protein [Dongiaceae bacterium]|jgi:1-acyl-sn-glycerol-3-phosphate acyltransferase|nr:lysophospholipid acyltransferase family protein [Dongiaceae bacterium]